VGPRCTGAALQNIFRWWGRGYIGLGSPTRKKGGEEEGVTFLKVDCLSGELGGIKVPIPINTGRRPNDIFLGDRVSKHPRGDNLAMEVRTTDSKCNKRHSNKRESVRESGICLLDQRGLEKNSSRTREEGGGEEEKTKRKGV